jgi:hypothetical protein
VLEDLLAAEAVLRFDDKNLGNQVFGLGGDAVPVVLREVVISRFNLFELSMREGGNTRGRVWSVE